jgi:murein DD-endopeptidase MepM/ murein hydrolase activator NlpD
MTTYILQCLVLIALPSLFIVSLWRKSEPDVARWLIKVLYTGAFLAYLFMLGRWDVLSVYLRYVLLLAYLAAVLVSVRGVQGRPWLTEGRARWRGYVVPLASLILFSAFAAFVARGYFIQANRALALEFPLRDGWFYIGQGGASTLLNHHHSIAAQRYALDIVALNGLGARARWAHGADLTGYVIYGMPVYSPCAGRVLAAVDEFPDQIPPQSDRRNLAGNHVVIACKGASVLLAHFQSGSVQVQRGQAVATQTLVGRVGNSGNTSEPHLHIHTVAGDAGNVFVGEGIPLHFRDKFLVRNHTLRMDRSAQ